MPPHEGLTHLKQYDVKDSNVELIGSNVDHLVKYQSAATEPAWNDGKVGQIAGLFVWRIEDFQVVAIPKAKIGEFYDGDSYIILHSYKLGDPKDGVQKLAHDIFFWLGGKTSQDEAGTAAYKTVELDEFLHGVGTQHREIQQQPSQEFVALFPRLSIRSGGVRSGFHHVDTHMKPEAITLLLRIFKLPAAGRGDSIIVHEVEPTWQSLDEDDVFVLDKGTKIWVWQGKKCSPMEKAKAAQVVNDLTLAKHIDVEVLAQSEARSNLVVDLLGGKDVVQDRFQARKPLTSSQSLHGKRPRRLLRLSDSSGELSFDLVKDGQPMRRADLVSKDIFLLDSGRAIWVWQGSGASGREKAVWIKVAHSYLRLIQNQEGDGEAHLTPLAKVVEGSESAAFFKALETP